MSAVLSALAVSDPAASPAARFTRLGRIGAAATLVLGATCQVVAFALAPNFSKTIDRLDWIAANPRQAEISKLFDLLAMPFLVGGVIVYVLLARERAPRFAWFGGIVLGIGMVGLSASQGFETLEFALVKDGRVSNTILADVSDNLTTAPEIALGVMFLGGVLIGIIATMIALWRSAAVPRGAVLLILAFVIVDIPLQRPLTAHVIALAAACWIAWSIMVARTPAAASA